MEDCYLVYCIYVLSILSFTPKLFWLRFFSVCVLLLLLYDFFYCDCDTSSVLQRQCEDSYKVSTCPVRCVRMTNYQSWLHFLCLWFRYSEQSDILRQFERNHGTSFDSAAKCVTLLAHTFGLTLLSQCCWVCTSKVDKNNHWWTVKRNTVTHCFL